MNTVCNNIISSTQSLQEPALECVHDHPYATALVAIGTCGIFYLSSNRPKLQARQEQNPTPEEVLSAAAEGNTERIRAIAKLGVNLFPTDERGQTSMHLAAKNGHTETVLELSGGFNARDRDGDTPMHLAARNGHTETVRALHDLGADVNSRDVHDCTPIFDAAAFGHTETVRALHELGADVNSRDEMDWTPIVYVVKKGQTETVKALHDLGADVNAQNKRGTPLDYAVESNKNECAERLISYGARSNNPANQEKVEQLRKKYMSALFGITIQL